MDNYEKFGVKVEVLMPTNKNMDDIIKKIKDYMEGKININVNIQDVEAKFKKVKDEIESVKKAFSSTFDKQTKFFIGNSDEPHKIVTQYTTALGEIEKIIQQAGKETQKIYSTDKSKKIALQSKLEELKKQAQFTFEYLEKKYSGSGLNLQPLLEKVNKINSIQFDDNNLQLPNIMREYNTELQNTLKLLGLEEQQLKKLSTEQEKLNTYKLKVSDQLGNLQSGKLSGFVDKSAINNINDILNGTKNLDAYTQQWITNEIKGIERVAKAKKELFDLEKKQSDLTTKAILTNEEKVTKALNTRMQSALKVEIGAAKLSPEGEAKIQNQLNRYKNIIKSFQEKNNLGIQISDNQLMKLQNLENRIKRYSEALRIAEKDSKGFSFGKFEKFNQLSSNIRNAGNAQQYFNKSILDGYQLLQAQVSETENYIRVTQKLRKGSEVRNLGVYIDKDSLQKGTVQAYKFSDSMKDLKTRTYDVGSAFLEAYRKIGLWAGATGLIYGAINAVQQMWATIVQVNTELTELSKVLSNDTDYTSLMGNLNVSANYYARSLTEAQEATLEFAKQGYEAAEATDLANSALLGANVTGLKSAEVAERLTGALAQFNLEASKSSTVIDKVNEVDNNFAVTSVGLLQAIQKSGEAAQQFGVDLDNLIGYVTAVQTSTRESGNVIGKNIAA